MGRAKKSVLLPFYGSIYKLKKLANIKILLSKAFIKISGIIKSLFSMRPQKSTDYFYVGRLGIYKKLLFIILLFICIAPIIYFEFFSKDNTVPVDIPVVGEYVYTDTALKDFTGSASILLHDDTLVYKGDVLKGICTGSGDLYGSNGLVLYSGEFKNNEYSGKGKLYSPAGKLVYEGLFESNKFNGKGTLYNINGSVRYSGEFIDGMKNGEGKLYDEMGVNLVYEGYFIEDYYEGNGLLYSEKGTELYKGVFKKNLYEGEGTLYDVNSTRPIYQGQFRNGLFDGLGTLYSSTGRNKFTGTFLKGVIDYACFLNVPTSELSSHFLSSPVMMSSENSNYITYNSMNVSFVVNSINFEDELTEEIAIPTINSILVYDRNSPIGLEECKSSQDFITKLGEPYYEGYTYALPHDLIALKSLMDNGLKTDNNELNAAISLIDDLEIEFLLEPSIKLYVISYEHNGCSLSLFLDSKDGNLMYYSLESL